MVSTPVPDEQFGDCFEADACVLDKSCQFYRTCQLAEDDDE